MSVALSPVGRGTNAKTTVNCAEKTNAVLGQGEYEEGKEGDAVGLTSHRVYRAETCWFAAVHHKLGRTFGLANSISLAFLIQGRRSMASPL